MDMQKTEVAVQLSTLLDLANLLSEEQKNFLIQNLIKKQQDNSKIHLPISIFSSNLSSLETICKYLREELNLPFNEMATLLNRQPITLRTSYNKSKQKHPKKFKNFNFSQNIPISKFKDRKYTTFEIVIIHLKENCNLSLNEIASLTQRNYKTVWTTYSRAKKK